MTDAGAMFSDGKAYERLMGRWSRLVGDGFLDWLDGPAGQRWLDVGCGNGAFTELLMSRCNPASLVAIDPSPGQIAYARDRIGAKGAEYHIGDAQALPFDDASFDAAAMALVISFVPDPLKAVQEMRRVVRPGGTVATYMWDIAGGGVPLHPISAALDQLGVPSPVRPNAAASGRQAMQQIWQQAGLQEVETRVISITVRYDDFDDFWDSNSVPVGPVGATIKNLSEDAREQLRNRLRAQLPTDADGRIAYPSFANAVKGRVPH